MKYSRVVVAAALQRYIEPPPVAVRSREVGIALAKEHKTPVDVIAVDAPVTLLAGTESTEEKLNRFVEFFRNAGVEVRSHLLSGKPSDQILEFLATLRSETSLLIIGSHSKRGPLDVGVGSTSSALVKISPCPVLMIWPSLREAERTQELMIPGYLFVFPYG